MRNIKRVNMHPAIAKEKLRGSGGSGGGEMSALKAWRKRQMVEDEAGGGKRTMRLTDVPRLYGIPTSTWHQWEQLPGDAEFRRPREASMDRICGEITRGEVSPADFYPPVRIAGEAASSGG